MGMHFGSTGQQHCEQYCIAEYLDRLGIAFLLLSLRGLLQAACITSLSRMLIHAYAFVAPKPVLNDTVLVGGMDQCVVYPSLDGGAGSAWPSETSEFTTIQ